MNFRDLLSSVEFWTVMGAVIGAVSTMGGAVMKWFNSRIECLDERVQELERESVPRSDFNTSLAEIYRKMDCGFQHLQQRLDELMKLMIQQKS